MVDQINEINSLIKRFIHKTEDKQGYISISFNGGGISNKSWGVVTGRAQMSGAPDFEIEFGSMDHIIRIIARLVEKIENVGYKEFR